jgi:hypothetical protein
LVTTEGRKTLSALFRAITGDPCPKAGVDTFRLVPWQANDLRIPLREKLVQGALARREAAHQKPDIFLILDDNLPTRIKARNGYKR